MILCFIPPVITTCLEVLLLGLADQRSGLRCFTCHLSPNCEDIQPVTLKAKWPGSIDWFFAFLIACAVKIFDIYVIACITLKFILDPKSEPWSKTLCKILSWLVAFPLILMTPVFGIVVFVLVPGLKVPESENLLLEYFPSEQLKVFQLIMLILFVTGAVLFLLIVVFMSCICKTIMSKKPVMDEIIEDDF